MTPGEDKRSPLADFFTSFKDEFLVIWHTAVRRSTCCVMLSAPRKMNLLL